MQPFGVIKSSNFMLHISICLVILLFVALFKNINATY